MAAHCIAHETQRRPHAARRAGAGGTRAHETRVGPRRPRPAAGPLLGHLRSAVAAAAAPHATWALHSHFFFTFEPTRFFKLGAAPLSSVNTSDVPARMCSFVVIVIVRWPTAQT